ncbi:MAG: hypothetical protein VYC42_00710 [Pseudomonadota bacterium]|nr:hypothetical protein [Pseudomonadota bacterium]
MMRTPILVSLLLIVGGAAGTYFIGAFDSSAFLPAEKASSIIAVWACVAAFVSAAFVIQSYLETNAAFQQSQMPHLRIWVQDATGPAGEHFTCVNYENMTLNAFSDLTIHVAVKAKDVVVDLDSLFPDRMFMAGRDQRKRTFNTVKELGARGYQIESESAKAAPPRLCIAYDYTFAGRMQNVVIQEYEWRRGWHIA